MELTQVGQSSARTSPPLDLLSAPQALTLIEPLDESGPIFCIFRLRFATNDNVHEVAVGARATAMEGVDVTLSSDTAATIQLRHGPMLQACTVTCLGTGDTRSGPPACIQCTAGEWTVTICC